MAALYGHLHIVNYFILDLKCDANLPDSVYCRGPIFMAAQKGHLSIVKSLIVEHGCHPASKDINQATPLHFAAQFGHLPIVDYLTRQLECDPLCKKLLHFMMHQVMDTFTWYNSSSLSCTAVLISLVNMAGCHYMMLLKEVTLTSSDALSNNIDVIHLVWMTTMTHHYTWQLSMDTYPSYST